MNGSFFGVTAPGLEHICADELRELGVSALAEEGGVAWSGDLRSLYRANLELRTASRIIARAGEFRARGFAELERHTARVQWSSFLPHDCSIALRVTSRKSKLYHEGAIAERVMHVLSAEVGARVEENEIPDDESDAESAATSQLLVIRVLRDVVTLSVDSSGALLHQRGYRRAIGMAPLRETLAAAVIRAAGWTAAVPLLDPFCGSGTIPIEAALLARRIPPGLATAEHEPRHYAFERWPGFDEDTWNDVVRSARAAILSSAPAPVLGSDRHGGAITAAAANAARAGVAADITFQRASLSSLQPPPGRGHVITNPPYGVRVGQRRELTALYAELGRIGRERLHGWTLHFLAPDDRLATATGLPLTERVATRNGGLTVRLLGSRLE